MEAIRVKYLNNKVHVIKQTTIVKRKYFLQ